MEGWSFKEEDGVRERRRTRMELINSAMSALIFISTHQHKIKSKFWFAKHKRDSNVGWIL